MRNVFEEVRLKWDGREYAIPPGQVLRCIAAVEGTGITLGQLIIEHGGAFLPMARLSQAVGVALRFAGCQISDDEVYDSLFADPARMTGEAITAAVLLQSLMIPPARMREQAEKIKAREGESAGKAQAGTAEVASSSSATSSSSAPAT